MSLPIVVATAVPANTPAKFSTAAIPTAIIGGKARVDTTVATAFGASVHPLTASNARIAMNVKTRKPKVSVTRVRLCDTNGRGSSVPRAC